MPAVALEAVDPRIVFQQPVNGPRFPAGGLGQALGGSAGGRAQLTMKSFDGKDFQDRSNKRGLAYTGTAGDDEDFLRGSLTDGVLLAISQLDFHFLLDPFQSGLDLNYGKRVTTTTQSLEGTGDADFRLEKFLEIEPRSPRTAARGLIRHVANEFS